jgi:CDP-diacylglycerol--serine O-phosphatidyltransferase
MWKKIKEHIPNSLTAGNLFFGMVGITFVFTDAPLEAFFCMMVSAVLDFFDGFTARRLKVSSPLGKELDSLADVVTFGVLPGLLLFRYYQLSSVETGWPAYLIFSIPVFSAFRLAMFNLDDKQTDHFRGLATPSNGLFIASTVNFLYAHPMDPHLIKYLIPIAAGVLSLLLIAPVKLIALKFKGPFGRRDWLLFIFIFLSLLSVVLIKFAAGLFILPAYFLFSFIYFFKKNDFQS